MIFCFNPSLYMHNSNDNKKEHGKLILEPWYSKIPLLYIKQHQLDLIAISLICSFLVRPSSILIPYILQIQVDKVLPFRFNLKSKSNYCLCDLTGAETLEWVSQKFKRRFHFFNLVSDFFFKKVGLNYCYLINYWEY